MEHKEAVLTGRDKGTGTHKVGRTWDGSKRGPDEDQGGWRGVPLSLFSMCPVLGVSLWLPSLGAVAQANLLCMPTAMAFQRSHKLNLLRIAVLLLVALAGIKFLFRDR